MIKKIKYGLIKAAGLMLAVMTLAACVISGTLAKYRSSATFHASLTVATWRFEINEDSTQPFPVSTEISISSLKWEVKPTEGISALPNENTIAPGTWGYAEIKIENVGDVDAVVTVSIENLKFPTQDDHGNQVADLNNRLTFALMKTPPDNESKIVDQSTEQPYSDTLVRSGKSGTNSLTCYLVYKWEFGTIDDGVNDNKFQGNTFDFGAFTITAKQVEPKKLAFSQPIPTDPTFRPTAKIDREVMTDE